MTNSTLTLRPGLAAELDALALTSGRSRDELAAEALQAYLDHHRWFVARVQEGVRQVEAGETFEHDEVFADVEALLAQRSHRS